MLKEECTEGRVHRGYVGFHKERLFIAYWLPSYKYLDYVPVGRTDDNGSETSQIIWHPDTHDAETFANNQSPTDWYTSLIDTILVKRRKEKETKKKNNMIKDSWITLINLLRRRYECVVCPSLLKGGKGYSHPQFLNKTFPLHRHEPHAPITADSWHSGFKTYTCDCLCGEGCQQCTAEWRRGREALPQTHLANWMGKLCLVAACVLLAGSR